eukprot:GHVS01031953.1.p1 GENE.GHVS01031953.1~~GHVS01031953.1.p1  ORF type:complete len:173 (+),score=25.77 GHVS01031953.1:73-591(+)
MDETGGVAGHVEIPQGEPVTQGVADEASEVMLEEPLEEGARLWKILLIVLVALGLLWIADKLYSLFLRHAEVRRNKILEKEKTSMQSARDRQIQRLEEEAENFKLTEEYQAILKASKNEGEGIQPHHHRHTVSRATDRALDDPTNSLSDRSFNTRSNRSPYDSMRRRPGGGG